MAQKTVQVRRSGTARVLRALINGVALKWDQKGKGPNSIPKKKPEGEYVLTWFVEGKKNQTYSFVFVSPAIVDCLNGQACSPAGTLQQDGFVEGSCRFNL